MQYPLLQELLVGSSIDPGLWAAAVLTTFFPAEVIEDSSDVVVGSVREDR